jgi:hypothetical protein
VFAWFGTWLISLVALLRVSIFQYEPHDILAFQDEHMDAEVTMQIFYKNFYGKSKVLRLAPSTTIAAVKQVIADQENFIFTQPADFRLSFQSRDLEDDRTLSDYGIPAESTLDMLGRVRGGADAEMDVDMEDIDISIISDEDIKAEFLHRNLMNGIENSVIMDVVEQRLRASLPAIPDTNSPQVCIQSNKYQFKHS